MCAVAWAGAGAGAEECVDGCVRTLGDGVRDGAEVSVPVVIGVAGAIDGRGRWVGPDSCSCIKCSNTLEISVVAAVGE